MRVIIYLFFFFLRENKKKSFKEILMVMVMVVVRFFNDLDYEIWVLVMKVILIEKEFWDVVENGVLLDLLKILELFVIV